MRPRVSVVITTFNQAAYIRAAVEAALGQTYRSREILVVDDGSTDETPTILAPYRGAITYIRQPNQGVAGARNTGVRHARGELVAFLDGDDLWDPEKLEVQVAAADLEPRAGVIAVDDIEFKDGEVLRSALLSEAVRARWARGEPMLTFACYPHLLRGNLVATTSQVMIPRRVLDAVGPSDTRWSLSSDWDLYLRIAARYPFTFVNRSLTQWRQLDTSASGPAATRWLRWARDDIEILKEQLQSGPPRFSALVQEELATRLPRAIQTVYAHGRYQDRAWAIRYLAHLFASNPTHGRILTHLAALCLPEPFVGGFHRMAARARRSSKPVELER
jgi:glycosyltransferase involved in cell wall biosynthesis